MDPFKYCEERTQKSGSSFYYAFYALPEEQRRAMHVLYAFCREVDDVVDETLDVEVARRTLAWWRMELSQAYASDGKPQHPVTQALREILKTFPLPREHLESLIDGMAMDLALPPFATWEDLKLYTYRVASTVGLLSIEIFGYSHPETRQYAEDLGHAFQLTNIARDLAEDAERGRCYVPHDFMVEAGADWETLKNGDWSPSWSVVGKRLGELARSYYQKAMAALHEEDRPHQLPGLIMAGIYGKQLDRLFKGGFDNRNDRLRMGRVAKLWAAWKVVQSEKKRQARTK